MNEIGRNYCISKYVATENHTRTQTRRKYHDENFHHLDERAHSRPTRSHRHTGARAHIHARKLCLSFIQSCEFCSHASVFGCAAACEHVP